MMQHRSPEDRMPATLSPFISGRFEHPFLNDSNAHSVYKLAAVACTRLAAASPTDAAATRRAFQSKMALSAATATGIRGVSAVRGGVHIHHSALKIAPQCPYTAAHSQDEVIATAVEVVEDATTAMAVTAAAAAAACAAAASAAASAAALAAASAVVSASAADQAR
mmetsp:Transcript_61345/g.102109  ORF Transcript_61345/g.102109 Transcript_61345/m.102109 type:complete len:166 (+) Transcript_61345:248-745(+)